MDLINIDLVSASVGGISVSALVVLLTNAIKGLLPEKFVKPLPYIVGVVVVLIVMGLSWANVGVGLILGALATGGYRLVKPK